MLTSVDQQISGQAEQRIIRSADQHLPSDMLNKKNLLQNRTSDPYFKPSHTTTEISILATTQPILNL